MPLKNEDYTSSSQEFESMHVWERYISLSRSFMEASHHLCESMLEEDFSSQYSSSRVVLHLARQGLELFLKGAIAAANPQPRKLTHNLETLFAQYRESCREPPGYFFELPARFRAPPNLELFESMEDPELFDETLDQRHRYPTDRAGKPFSTPEIFDPKEVLEEINELQRTMGILEFKEIRPNGNPPGWLHRPRSNDGG